MNEITFLVYGAQIQHASFLSVFRQVHTQKSFPAAVYISKEYICVLGVHPVNSNYCFSLGNLYAVPSVVRVPEKEPAVEWNSQYYIAGRD